MNIQTNQTIEFDTPHDLSEPSLHLEVTGGHLEVTGGRWRWPGGCLRSTNSLEHSNKANHWVWYPTWPIWTIFTYRGHWRSLDVTGGNLQVTWRLVKVNKHLRTIKQVKPLSLIPHKTYLNHLYIKRSLEVTGGHWRSLEVAGGHLEVG